MGVEEIIARISADAAAEAERILREAADEEARIRQEGEAAAAQEYAAICDAGGREAQARRRKILARAHLTARTEIRKAREAGIAASFAGAGRALSALPGTPEYAMVLQRLIAEGHEVVGPGDVRVLYREEDGEALREALAGLPDIAADILKGEPTDRAGGGVIVTCRSHRCDQRFVARCERMRERLTRETARILFGNDE
jgi:vacuolar-type H+-ATPase subunit E/Vma4